MYNHIGNLEQFQRCLQSDGKNIPEEFPMRRVFRHIFISSFPLTLNDCQTVILRLALSSMHTRLFAEFYTLSMISRNAMKPDTSAVLQTYLGYFVERKAEIRQHEKPITRIRFTEPPLVFKDATKFAKLQRSVSYLQENVYYPFEGQLQQSRMIFESVPLLRSSLIHQQAFRSVTKN